MSVISPETRMMGLPYGEEIMIVGRTMWTQSTSVTDKQTDRITITNTMQRVASHGKNQRTTFCRGGHGELMAKKWLDFIEKQKKTIRNL